LRTLINERFDMNHIPSEAEQNIFLAGVRAGANKMGNKLYDVLEAIKSEIDDSSPAKLVLSGILAEVAWRMPNEDSIHDEVKAMVYKKVEQDKEANKQL
jgi:hypothetical protein